MLFDLRGRGRRRTVQGIYLGLAILMGGGLVLFGVGGNVSGGLLDAIKNNPSSTNNDVFQKRLEAAEKLATAQPKNAQAWANVVKLRFQVAGDRRQLRRPERSRSPTRARPSCSASTRRGTHYLDLDPKKIDATAATYMVQAYAPGALDQSDKLVRAYELVIDGTPKPTYDQYRNLAIYSYVGRPDRARATSRAARRCELAPKDQRDDRQAADRRPEDRRAQAGDPVGRRHRPDGSSAADSLSFAAAPL